MLKNVVAAVSITIVCLFAGASYGAENSPPNVVFCIADDASCHFGAYGCNWVKTPNVDRLAREGIVFDNAYTATAKCAPSRAAILTGRNPWQLEAAANHQSYFPPNYKGFTEALDDAGFYVGSLGKFWGPGIARNADGSPRTWGLVNLGPKKSGANVEGINRGFGRFLSERPKDKPFFFWFGSGDPHRPYKRDAGLAAGKQPADVDHVPAYWPDNDVVRRDMLDYATEIEAYDSQIGAILKLLEEHGQRDNTLLIVTSDHGMPFPRVKGHNYDLANRVPFVVSWPRGIAHPGRHASDLLSLIDVAPTLLELFSVPQSSSGMQPITGRSFSDLLAGQSKQDRSSVILGRERNDVRARPGTPAGLGYPVRGIRQGSLLYLHNFAPDRWPCGNPELGLLDTDDGPTKQFIEGLGQQDRYWQFCFGKRPADELFDLASDPDCVKNLAADPGYREVLAKLSDQLTAELKRQNDPRILGHGDVFENYPTSKDEPAAPKKSKAKAAKSS
ncbi:MAG TPA: sulfatase [Pirellulales bacterium]|nr:sulfatase [Pirellulales bacterium]